MEVFVVESDDQNWYYGPEENVFCPLIPKALDIVRCGVIDSKECNVSQETSDTQEDPGSVHDSIHYWFVVHLGVELFLWFSSIVDNHDVNVFDQILVRLISLIFFDSNSDCRETGDSRKCSNHN